MKRSAMLVAVFAAIAMTGLSAHAQSARNETQEAAPPAVATLPPAYEKEMLRLAEVLGALHYLRDLCGGEDGEIWRAEMERMLEVEEPTEQRRQMLIASFNRGFRGFREVYRECTPAAAEAANRYLKQGIRLSAEIPNRFGN